MAINSADELARYGYLSGAGFGESIKNSILGPQGYYPIVQKARDTYLQAQFEADRIGLESDRLAMLQSEHDARKAEKADAEAMNMLAAEGMLSMGVPAKVRPLVEKAAKTGQDLSKFAPTLSMFGDEAAKQNAAMAEAGDYGPAEPGTPFASSSVKEKIAKEDEREAANAPYVAEYERLSGQKPTRKQMRTSDLSADITKFQTQKEKKKAEGTADEEDATYSALAEKKGKPVPEGLNPKIYYAALLENEKAAKESKTLYVNLKNEAERKAVTIEDAATLPGKDWVTFNEWEARTRPQKEPAGEAAKSAKEAVDTKEKLRASLARLNGAANAIMAGKPVGDLTDIAPEMAPMIALFAGGGKELTPEQKDMAIRQIRTLQAQTARDLRNAPKSDPNESNNYPVPPFGDLFRVGPNGETIGLTDPASGDPDVPLRYGMSESGQFTATVVSPFGQHTLYADTVDELRKKALSFALQYPESGYSVVKVNPQTGRIYNAAQTLLPATRR